MHVLGLAGPAGAATSAVQHALCPRLSALHLSADTFATAAGYVDSTKLRAALNQLSIEAAEWVVVSGRALLSQRRLWDLCDRVVLLDPPEHPDVVLDIRSKWRVRYRQYNIPLELVAERWSVYWHSAQPDSIIVRLDPTRTADDVVDEIVQKLEPQSATDSEDGNQQEHGDSDVACSPGTDMAVDSA